MCLPTPGLHTKTSCFRHHVARIYQPHLIMSDLHVSHLMGEAHATLIIITCASAVGGLVDIVSERDS